MVSNIVGIGPGDHLPDGGRRGPRSRNFSTAMVSNIVGIGPDDHLPDGGEEGPGAEASAL